MAVDTAAVAAGLAGDGDVTPEHTRLAGVAKALVERHVGDGSPPDEIENEAAIRVAGWLRDAPVASRRVRVGDVEQEYLSASRAALRASGAMSLLSPWVQRRGVVL